MTGSIDISDEILFDEAEWVGKGRQWPTQAKDVPLGLADFREANLNLPESVASKVRKIDALSAEHLLKYPLPKRSHQLAFKPVNSCFRAELPNDVQNKHIDTFLDRPIPQLSFIEQALEGVGQALLDGKQSFEDPHYPGSRLPLWVLRWWSKMWKVTESREVWKRGYDWLNKHLREHAAQSVQHIELMAARAT
jgi:hypothetical protein